MSVDPDIIGRYLIRSPLWFVDVGVGEGKEAMAMRSLYPNVQLLGLEPNKELYEKAKVQFPGIILNVGAWSSNKRLHMHDMGQQSNCFGLGDDTCELVQMMQLDELFQRYGIREAVLWMDIEGAELEALRGATDALRKHVVAINCETRVQRLYPRSCCMSEVDAYLASFGFRKVTTYNYCGGDDPHEDAVYVRSH